MSTLFQRIIERNGDGGAEHRQTSNQEENGPLRRVFGAGELLGN